MTWNPFGNKESDAVNIEEGKEKLGPDGKPIVEATKTQAELIAESLKPLTALTENFTRMSQRLEAIEAQTKKPEAKRENVESISVLDDENAAFAQRMTPLLIRQFELEARIVKDEIKTEYVAAGYGDLWGKFAVEINKIIDESPIATGEGKPFRGDPQYIRNVVDMVMGRHAREAGMRFDGKSKGFFLETGGNGTEHSGAPQNDGLTEGQRQVFGRMKVSLDDAKKVMGKLKFVTQ